MEWLEANIVSNPIREYLQMGLDTNNDDTAIICFKPYKGVSSNEPLHKQRIYQRTKVSNPIREYLQIVTVAEWNACRVEFQTL